MCRAIWDRNCELAQKQLQARPKGGTQIIKSQPQIIAKMNENSTQHRHNTGPNIIPIFHPKLIQIRPNICPKSIQNRQKIVPKSAPGPTWAPRPFLNRFLTNFGSNLGPSWGPSWGHVGTMLAKKSIFGNSRRHAKTIMISNTFRDPLGTDFGTTLKPKIEPKSVQDRSQERS